MGGIWIDRSIEFIGENFNNIFVENTALYASLSEEFGEIENGILASPSENPTLHHLLMDVVNNIDSVSSVDWFRRHMFRVLTNDLGKVFFS